jgi:hypothetical protein
MMWTAACTRTYICLTAAASNSLRVNRVILPKHLVNARSDIGRLLLVNVSPSADKSHSQLSPEYTSQQITYQRQKHLME